MKKTFFLIFLLPALAFAQDSSCKEALSFLELQRAIAKRDIVKIQEIVFERIPEYRNNQFSQSRGGPTATISTHTAAFNGKIKDLFFTAGMGLLVEAGIELTIKGFEGEPLEIEIKAKRWSRFTFREKAVMDMISSRLEEAYINVTKSLMGSVDDNLLGNFEVSRGNDVPALVRYRVTSPMQVVLAIQIFRQLIGLPIHPKKKKNFKGRVFQDSRN